MKPSQEAGAADKSLANEAHQKWIDEAKRAGIDLSGFDANATLEQRLIWAASMNLLVATIYVRFSTKLQHSTADQIRACVEFAARNGMYVPPEFICVDEGAKGRRVRRDGLFRLKALLKSRRVAVLLVYKVSRLFRQAFRGYQLIQEEVVEEGLRAVSVSQGIDTADDKTWKAQLALHGLLDDLLLDAIGDHCREGLTGLFLQGYVTGALTNGYKAVEVPGATPTNLGKPRKMPAKDEDVATMILQHYEWFRDGMPLAEGFRRWHAAGGSCDKRSTTGEMTPPAYRRMLSNVRYTGRWEFGRKRNFWYSKKDYTRQIRRPDSDVRTYRCEELRVVSDELFLAVQQRLRSLETGPRARKPRDHQMWELVTDLFHCPHCHRRYHTCGPHMNAMHCPRPLCPGRAMVDRHEAVQAICTSLLAQIRNHNAMIDQVMAIIQKMAASGTKMIANIPEKEARLEALTKKIVDLCDMTGQGSDDDRRARKAHIRAAELERESVQIEIAQLRRAAESPDAITADGIISVLKEYEQLLQDGMAGNLDRDAVIKAAGVLRRLMKGSVQVCVETRAGRKRANVRGRFVPRVAEAIAEAVGVPSALINDTALAEVEVWLREPPRLDGIADEVRRLYEEEGLGFRAIAKKLMIGCGNIYQSYLRYYELRGQPVPPRRPRGRSRSA